MLTANLWTEVVDYGNCHSHWLQKWPSTTQPSGFLLPPSATLGLHQVLSAHVCNYH